MLPPERMAEVEKHAHTIADELIHNVVDLYQQPKQIQDMARLALGIDASVDINDVQPPSEREVLLSLMSASRDRLNAIRERQADRQDQANNMTQNARTTKERRPYFAR